MKNDLFQYIKYLEYKTFRYKFLLDTIQRDFCEMTDEEWDDSLKYFNNKYQEFLIQYLEAKNQIQNILNIPYKFWRINYENNSIIEFNNEIEMNNYIPYFNNLNSFAKVLAEEENNYSKKIDVVEFELTNKCNASCSYCFEKHKGNNSMNFNDAKKYIDLILSKNSSMQNRINSYESIGVQIWFLGGEPLLEIELIEEITKYFIGELFRLKHPWITWFYFRISTNSLLYFNEKVQSYFKKYQKCLVCSLTLDLNKETHNSNRVDINGIGTYNKVMNCAFHARDNFKNVLVPRIIITPYNLDNFFKTIVWLYNNNFYHYEVALEFHSNWNKVQANIFFNQLIKIIEFLKDIDYAIDMPLLKEKDSKDQCKKGCQLLKSKVIIDYSGKIYPCIQMGETSSGKNYLNIGTADNGIGFSKEEQDNLKLIENYYNNKDIPNECELCKIANQCFCCPAYDFIYQNILSYKNRNCCYMTKVLYLANLYFLSQKYNNQYKCLFTENEILDILNEENYSIIKEVIKWK